MSSRTALALALITLAATGAVVTTQSPGTPGSALPGISPVEFEEFRIGLEDFLEVEEAEEGLGPAFNGTSCASCHSIPAVGGTSTIAEVRAGRRNARGEFETLDASGETLFHLFSLPTHSCQPIMPPDADIVARRVPIALFGAGLVEAILDDTLIALEDPNDRNGDGVSGRAGLVVDVGTGERRVGRFGWKSQHATLLAFSGDAYTQRDGHHGRPVPARGGYGVTADRMRACDIPIPIRRIFAIREHGSAASTTSRASCSSWRLSGVDRSMIRCEPGSGSSRPLAVRRVMCRR
jgi:hypothetical protein